MDGEISPEDAAKLERYFERNPAAIDWMESLDATRADSHDEVEGSSEHLAAIEALRVAVAEAETSPADDPTFAPARLLRFPQYLPSLAAAAAIAVIGIFAWIGVDGSKASSEHQDSSVVEFVSTDIPDASTFVYTDEESGWTVVWVESMEPLPEEHG